MSRWLRMMVAGLTLFSASGCLTMMSVTATNESDKEPLYYTIPLDILILPATVVVAPLFVIFVIPAFAFHG